MVQHSGHGAAAVSTNERRADQKQCCGNLTYASTAQCSAGLHVKTATHIPASYLQPGAAPLHVHSDSSASACGGNAAADMQG